MEQPRVGEPQVQPAWQAHRWPPRDAIAFIATGSLLLWSALAVTSILLHRSLDDR